MGKNVEIVPDEEKRERVCRDACEVYFVLDTGRPFGCLYAEMGANQFKLPWLLSPQFHLSFPFAFVSLKSVGTVYLC